MRCCCPLFLIKDEKAARHPLVLIGNHTELALSIVPKRSWTLLPRQRKCSVQGVTSAPLVNPGQCFLFLDTRKEMNAICFKW
jgi:hypothetical protein